MREARTAESLTEDRGESGGNASVFPSVYLLFNSGLGANPKEIPLKAQGCEERATLGGQGVVAPTLTSNFQLQLAIDRLMGHYPFGIETIFSYEPR